jgi:hypothetical protein
MRCRCSLPSRSFLHVSPIVFTCSYPFAPAIKAEPAVRGQFEHSQKNRCLIGQGTILVVQDPFCQRIPDPGTADLEHGLNLAAQGCNDRLDPLHHSPAVGGIFRVGINDDVNPALG